MRRHSAYPALVGGLAALVMLAALIVPVASAAQEQDAELFGRYYALVIGNTAYQHLEPLETPVNDASVVADLLRRDYGFEVELMLNVTRDQLVSALNRLRRDLTPNDNLLIYYAGHGILDEITDTGYWLPVDADKDDDTRWVANSTITRHVRGMAAKHVMVVADSCYSGTLTRGIEAGLSSGAEREAWLARMAQKRSRTALTSGGLEPVTDSGGHGHSVFARQFIEALRDNDQILDGQRLYQAIKQNVVLNADQTPSYNDIRKAGHENGDFLFVPKTLALARTNPAAPASSPADAGGGNYGRQTHEAMFWEEIKDSNDPEMLRAYLEEFPTGTFARLARIKLARLTQDGGGTPATPPDPATPPALRALVGPVDLVTVARVTVRHAPDPGAGAVLSAAAGTPVTVIAAVADTDWYQVALDDGRTGFLRGNALGGWQEASTVDPAPAADATAQRAIAQTAQTAQTTQTEAAAAEAAPDVRQAEPKTTAEAETVVAARPSPTTTPTAPPDPVLSGLWDTTYGTIAFPNVAPGPIEFSYPGGDGRFFGEFDGREITGIWVEPSGSKPCAVERHGSPHWGTARFVFNSDLSRYEGQWGYCDGLLTSGWVGRKVAEGNAASGRFAALGGVWQTTYGAMRFSTTVEGVVRAPYATSGGRVIGTFDGTRLTGIWVEDSAARACSATRDGSVHWGRVEFLFNEALNAFEGRWGYCDDNPRSAWAGERYE